jgi:hypothetical protein
MTSVIEVRTPGRPQEHPYRVTFRSAGDSRTSTGDRAIQGQPANTEALRDVIRVHQ